MKIDIKSIVSTLSSGVSEIKSTSKALNIREALGETVEEAEAEAVVETAEEIEDETETETVEENEDETETVAEEVEAEKDREMEREPEHEAAEDVVEEEASEVEPDPETEAEPETQVEPNPETEAEPETQVEPDSETETEPEETATTDEETANDEEISADQAGVDEGVPEDLSAEEDISSEEPSAEEDISEEDISSEEPSAEEPQSRPSPFRKEKLLAWGRKYGWLTGIAASFLILIAFMVVYTTMTPREIHATINGEEISFTTEEYTIEGFLEDENIEFCEEDYISVPLTTFIQEGVAFELKHATDFTVTADGKTKKYKTLDNTVQQALDDVGIKVGERDIVKPKLDTLLEKNMSIVVQRVVAKKEVVEEEVSFKTIEKDDVTMNEGTSKVVTKGKKGKDKVTYEIIYIDGKESSRKEIARKTITAAVDEVIANGTRVNYNGKTYSRKLVVKAYAYTGGGTTAMGTRARVGEIAVDPSVIPLGTNVYIEGVGPRRAEDTGGNIKGNTIDIYMNTQSECINWGMRYVTIYIE